MQPGGFRYYSACLKARPVTQKATGVIATVHAAFADCTGLRWAPGVRGSHNCVTCPVRQ